jgi:hypothetical protein
MIFRFHVHRDDKNAPESLSAARLFLFAGRRKRATSKIVWLGSGAREEGAGDCLPGIDNLMDVT